MLKKWFLEYKVYQFSLQKLRDHLNQSILNLS